MPLSLTEEQRQIQSEARRCLSDAFAPEKLRALLSAPGAFDRAFWSACVDMGWLGAGLPEAHGGLGLGALETCLIAEECGRVACGAPFLASSYAVGQALLNWADAKTRTALAPSLISGDARFAIAILGVDGDIPAMPALTFKDGRLVGAARAVPGAAAASHALVYAMAAEPVLALVQLDAGNVTPFNTFDNTRNVSDIQFAGAEAVALSPPDARAAALDVLATWATILAFEQIGGAEAVMHRARTYACERQAFGQPIGKFQAIKHRIAEMYVAIELARGNALLAAAGLTEGASDRSASAAAARLTATEAYEFAAAEAIQIHGAIGAAWEHDLHLFFRRSRALALEAGARFFWEDVIVDALQERRA